MLALSSQKKAMNEKLRPTLTRINRKLSKAAELLDSAARDLRDVGLSPRENIRKIASALMEVFEIQLQIYRREPALAPAYVKKSPGVARRPTTTKNKRAQRQSKPSRNRSR
jgi:hypothetical protein